MTIDDTSPGIAFFITSHGFGHVTRACAVMNAIFALRADLRFIICTQAPLTLFEQSLTFDFDTYNAGYDVAIKQLDPLREDLSDSLSVLDSHLPFTPPVLDPIVKTLENFNTQLVVCDISPLGIAAAHRAGLRSVVIENFTWHWIFEGYAAQRPRMASHAAYLREEFAVADYHIQTEPVCELAAADLTVPPISRAPRLPADEIRSRLGIPVGKPVVVITMGGVKYEYDFFDRLRQEAGIHFIVPGGGDDVATEENVSRLPWDCDFYHPDLVSAAAAVVGKIGYSTLAEVYHAGVPFGYIGRKAFRESAVLMDYVAERMEGAEVSEADFRSGNWLAVLPELLSKPRSPRRDRDGAADVARFICDLISDG